ncbi:hypothetical protein [Streptomyces sp. CB03238]|uniref:hypothetical protein n=1 Tax=Streptomyces sp. CB03238 TaxID=1907777 RepID=UPI000A11702E|nr:hypothetical protein [Streptomyces sp. CB03238]ORT57873.1 hypothetical protein BKD26_22170 [Streptomyces sp. CB03238]
MQQLSEFLMTQKITALVNRYVITEPGGGGVVAFAEQKRFKLKEEITLWTGEDRSEVLGGFKARQVVDLGATYDVTGPDGASIGTFRKDAKASLLRSTWHLTQGSEGEEPAVKGTERSLGIALARRGWEVVDAVLPFPLPVPFVYHFDFVRDGGQPVMSVERKIGFRDQYAIRIQHPALDRRLALCMAVALDALQSR